MFSLKHQPLCSTLQLSGGSAPCEGRGWMGQACVESVKGSIAPARGFSLCKADQRRGSKSEAVLGVAPKKWAQHALWVRLGPQEEHSRRSLTVYVRLSLHCPLLECQHRHSHGNCPCLATLRGMWNDWTETVLAERQTADLRELARAVLVSELLKRTTSRTPFLSYRPSYKSPCST